MYRFMKKVLRKLSNNIINMYTINNDTIFIHKTNQISMNVQLFDGILTVMGALCV